MSRSRDSAFTARLRSRISNVSVISKVSRSGSMPHSRVTARMSAASSSWLSCWGERFSERLTVGAGGLAPGPQLVAGGLEHPAPEPVDAAGLLEDGDELLGGTLPRTGCVQRARASKALVCPVPTVDDRLVVQLEGLLLEGPDEVGLEGEAVASDAWRMPSS